MIRVIGLGAPFGDDRAGWRVIDALRDQAPAAVDLVALDRPGATLINGFDGVSALYIVDAVNDGGPAGRVLTLTADDILAIPAHISSHQLNLPSTLRLARSLRALPPSLTVVGITIADLAQSSPAVEAGIRQAADIVAQALCEKIGACNALP